MQGDKYLDENGVKPADYALERNEPILYALLNPEGANAKGAGLRESFRRASIVHVLSTRYRKAVQGRSADMKELRAGLKGASELAERADRAQKGWWVGALVAGAMRRPSREVGCCSRRYKNSDAAAAVTGVRMSRPP